MQALLAQTKMEIKLFFREAIAMFFTFLLPGVMYLVFGNMYGDMTYGELSFFEAYVPGFIGVIIFTTGFFTVGLQVIIDREKGVYKRLGGTPIKASAIFGAIVTKGLFAVSVGMIEIFLLTQFYFQQPLPDHMFTFLAAVLAATITFMAMGFLVASLVNRVQTAMAVTFILMYPMLFLSGATIPLEGLPEGMQTAANFIPLKYANEYMQFGYAGELFTADALPKLAVLAGVTIVCAFIGMKKFRWNTR